MKILYLFLFPNQNLIINPRLISFPSALNKLIQPVNTKSVFISLQMSTSCVVSIKKLTQILKANSLAKCIFLNFAEHFTN